MAQRELKTHSIKLGTHGKTHCRTEAPDERKTYNPRLVTCLRCQHLDDWWQRWNKGEFSGR